MQNLMLRQKNFCRRNNLNILFQKAKNGEETAIADKLFLHSNYAPSKEAERFVENLSIPYTPSAIIITEPCLSYISEFLRKKYPEVRLGAIRYCPDFAASNKDFDFVLNFYEHPDFDNYLSSVFNEEELLSIFFTGWQPAAKAFYDTDKSCWNAIKKALENAKTLLVTRQYFEKKWLVNTFTFLKCLRNPVSLDFHACGKIKQKILIIASGPSLKAFLQIIRDNTENFFIICLSSAISICLENNIIPDLCISTDGGYWAGEHLKKLEQNNIVLALPPEAFCKKTILEKNRILPLIYNNGISNILLKKSGINYLNAERNGTVSGTALKFALQYFSSDIYFCGLDLAPEKGFQHTQPNELEANNSCKDNRIITKEKRLCTSGFSSASLEIYLNWFKNQKFYAGRRNVYRVINDEDKKNQLGEIKDINILQFQNMIQDFKKSETDFKKNKTEIFINQNTKINLKEIYEYFEKESENNNIKKGLFPLDFVSLSHNTDNSDIQKKIEERYSSLVARIRKIVYD